MKDPILILLSLRWDVDQVIRDPISADYWWLKSLIKDGERIGITDCCEYGYECPHHQEVRDKLEIQCSKLN